MVAKVESAGGNAPPKNKTNAKKRITPKNQKGHVLRALKDREPKIVENTKTCLVLKGSKVSQDVTDVLKDLALLLKPHAHQMSRKNEVRPFEDATSLEFMMNKNDCALFAFGNHSKKRPHNLILGRTYDGHILDMVEFGVTSLAPLASFKGVAKKRQGTKPAILFHGDAWEQDTTLDRVRNLLLDMFRGDDAKKLSLAGLDHVVDFTAIGNSSILIRNYTLEYLKSGSRTPRVQLTSMGPSFTLTIRRHQLAGNDLWRTACREPKELKTKKVKNESQNVFGDKVGRLHLGRQDVDKMRVKRMKALRTPKGESEGKEGDEPQDNGEDEGGDSGEEDEGFDSGDEYDDMQEDRDESDDEDV